MRIPAVILLLMFLSVYTRTKGDSSDPCHHSTEGTEFWFGFMQGRNTNNHYVEITVTSREDASFQVYIGKSATPDYTDVVKANSTTRIRLDYLKVEPTVTEQNLDMGIHLVSDKKVNVYSLNHDNNSSDVAVMYPTESLGTGYFTMCYKPHLDTANPNHGRNSEFVIVATQDNTKVTITPSRTTDGLHPANVPFTVILDKGQLYQVQAIINDLTGSFISSDKPIAVYAGSLSTTIPFETPNGGWDHMYEQMPPVNTWGREYYAVPLLTRSKDYFRVMSSQDSATVYIGSTSISLNRGEFHEFTLNTPTKIFSDKQILVSQYSQSRSNDGATNGDGFMIILSPISQAKNDVTFEAYTSTLIRVYYVNIVTPTSEVGNIELDGGNIYSFNPFPDDQRFSFAQLPISPGTHRLQNRNPNGGFIAYVYAFGGNEAYGYGVGFNLSLVLDLSEGLKLWPHLSEKGDTLAICRGESVKLDADPYYDFYNWNTGDSVRAISVSTEALFSVKAWTVDGCEKKDSIYIRVNDPHTDIGKDMAGCPPFSAILDGGEGFDGYLWNTGAKTRNLAVDSTGQYSVQAYDKYGCPAKDTVNFKVYPVPVVSLSGDTLLCGSQTGKMNVTFSGTDDSIWKGGSFNWETSQPAQMDFSGKTITSTDFTVKGWGKYNVSYTLTTVDNCVAKKENLSVGLYQNPTADLVTQDPGKCGEYNRVVVYTGNASSNANFNWDYGGLALLRDIDWKTKQISLGEVSSKPYISLFVEENGCHSDTFRLPVGANPSFTMNTAKSRGCDSATISFTGKLNVPDNQLQFYWNFGDHSGNSTSSLQSPSYLYTIAGNYDVSLLITNKITGCQVGFTVDDMVKIFTTPTAKISTDPFYCYGDTIPIVYTLNIDSSFCYWDFNGAHQTGKGNDSIRIVIDQPVAKIGLTVDEYGCKSMPVETTVKRKPNFDFTATPAAGCQPLTVNFKPFKADMNLTYRWKADTMKSGANEPSFLYTQPGRFSTRLIAYSTETGCTDSVKKTNYISVYPKPSAAFVVDYPVAILGQSNLKFTNQTLLADKFAWDFGDGLASTDKNPRHDFTALGKYPVLLFADSEFGCRDTTGMEIEILPFDISTPNAFRPESHISENKVFMPFTIGVSPEKFHMQIFNRWGEMIFESKSLQYPWDGTLKNSARAPAGNYVWIADYTDIQGFRHQRKGQVLLIR